MHHTFGLLQSRFWVELLVQPRTIEGIKEKRVSGLRFVAAGHHSSSEHEACPLASWHPSPSSVKRKDDMEPDRNGLQMTDAKESHRCRTCHPPRHIRQYPALQLHGDKTLSSTLHSDDLKALFWLPFSRALALPGHKQARGWGRDCLAPSSTPA